MHATLTIWHKHMTKFFRNREELGGLLIQPILWVVLFGVGMGALVGPVGGGDYLTFMLPGILALTLFADRLAHAIIKPGAKNLILLALVLAVILAAVVWIRRLLTNSSRTVMVEAAAVPKERADSD